MRAIDRWRRLTREEKRLVLRAACSIATAAVALRVRGLKRMLAAESAGDARQATEDAENARQAAEIQKFVAAVERAGRYVPGATCLTESLAMARMLRKCGIAAEVRIGVRTDDGFHAHAWVEVKGAAITSESGHEALTRN